MALFDNVLLTSDFDCTLTDRYTRIPQRNLDAITFFIENGGKFTVNTGRSINLFRNYLDKLPVNAPVLLWSGGVRWDGEHISGVKTLDLPVWQTLHQIAQEFPALHIEVDGLESFYLINPSAEMMAFYDARGIRYTLAQDGQDLGPFLKFTVMGNPQTGETTWEREYFDCVEARINQLWGDKVVIYRAAPRHIDVHPKGSSKGSAARELLNDLGRSILVCVGDAVNDISMLEGADFGFCPADGVVADRFPNVCACAEGAVADVIYKKIPEILGLCLDKQ